MFLNRIYNALLVFIILGSTSVIAQHTNSLNSENTMTQKLIQPPYLKAGDTVAIVAPSGILMNRETEIQRAKKLLKSCCITLCSAVCSQFYLYMLISLFVNNIPKGELIYPIT